MLISIKNDTQNLNSTCHALSQRLRGVIISFLFYSQSHSKVQFLKMQCNVEQQVNMAGHNIKAQHRLPPYNSVM